MGGDTASSTENNYKSNTTKNISNDQETNLSDSNTYNSDQHHNNYNEGNVIRGNTDNMENMVNGASGEQWFSLMNMRS